MSLNFAVPMITSSTAASTWPRAARGAASCCRRSACASTCCCSASGRETDPDVDESVLAGEAPAAYVERVARAKAAGRLAAHASSATCRAPPVLAADTTVALDGRILGKPADRARGRRDARRALGQAPRGADRGGAQARRAARVRAFGFGGASSRPLSADEIAQYVATGECDDKAGAYAHPGPRRALRASSCAAATPGVMGLPLYETSQLARRSCADAHERRNPH